MLVKVRLVKNFENKFFSFNENFKLDEILLKLCDFSEEEDFLEVFKDWNKELIYIKEEEELEGNVKKFSLIENYIDCFEFLLENINYIELMNDEDEEDEDEFYEERFTITELIEERFNEDECKLIVLP